MVLGGRSWVLHCLGISWTISLLPPPTPTHTTVIQFPSPWWVLVLGRTLLSHTSIFLWRNGKCRPLGFLWEVVQVGTASPGSECCQERLLQPTTPCWRLSEPISPVTPAATQELGIGQTMNIIQFYPQLLLSLCNAASSHPISMGTFIESTVIPFPLASFSLPNTTKSTCEYNQGSLLKYRC